MITRGLNSSKQEWSSHTTRMNRRSCTENGEVRPTRIGCFTMYLYRGRELSSSAGLGVRLDVRVSTACHHASILGSFDRPASAQSSLVLRRFVFSPAINAPSPAITVLPFPVYWLQRCLKVLPEFQNPVYVRRPVEVRSQRIVSFRVRWTSRFSVSIFRRIFWPYRLLDSHQSSGFQQIFHSVLRCCVPCSFATQMQTGELSGLKLAVLFLKRFRHLSHHLSRLRGR